MSEKVSEGGVAPATRLEDLIIEQHLRHIFVLIYRIVGTVEDAQDLTQEVFIKVLQKQEQLRDPAKIAQWLSRIATNTAIDHLRRRGRAQWLQLEEWNEDLQTPAASSPEQQLLRKETHRQLESCLDVLTARERVALVLRDVEGLPASEVAKRLGCSQATVRSHIANARAKLRNWFARSRKNC